MQIRINDKTIEANEGEAIHAAAARNDIEIPTLCHHADLEPIRKPLTPSPSPLKREEGSRFSDRLLTPVGSCRMCLVEVAGQSQPQTACNTPIFDGMQVVTENERLNSHRKMILEQLLETYYAASSSEDQSPNEFMRWVKHYRAESHAQKAPRFPVDSDSNPFIAIDLNQCILCTRCVRACEEIQGRFVWSVAGRGEETRVVCGNEATMLDAGCESCGACAAYCPTGALTDRFEIANPQVDRKVRTTCAYCGVGCQFDLNIKQEKIVRVTSESDAPVNGMSLCVKGRYGFEYVHHSDRVLRPRVRRYLLENKTSWRDRPADRGEWVEVDWSTALPLVANRFAAIGQQNGPNAIGVMSSAKCTNEENYLMQKFARQVIGTHNIDHCARLCHSSTVAGLGMAIGSGAMSNSMDDIVEHAVAIFIIGSNTTEQHPVFGAMLRQAALRRRVPIVVADPRRIDITEFATLHIRQKPGTDVALINGLMHIAVKNNWHDMEFIENRCEEFDALNETIERYSPEVVAETTGVSVDELHQAAEILCQNSPMATIWAMGITQHKTGVINVLSLANLQLLLGNFGIAGGGVNPLRGQNNVQGACDMGCLPNVFPGYQSVADSAVCEKFDAAWQLEDSEVESLPENLLVSPFSKPKSLPENLLPSPLFRREGLGVRGFQSAPNGLTVTEMIEAAGNGTVRGLYILGEDPAMTEPDSNHARECLQRSEFVVLQEILESETAAYADVLLPGCSFAEKNGTFTNTERRIQPVRQAIAPISDTRHDWQITSELANGILSATDRAPVGPHASWNYESSADILREINRLTPSYAGATPERIESGERLQWPVVDESHPGTPIMHVKEFPRGRGRFHVVDHLPPAELPDEEFPFLLTTGRVLYHWHGGELTRRVAGLTEVCPEPQVEINPEDAVKLSIDPHQLLSVKSRRGVLLARAQITDRVSSGIIFANFHFPDEGNANNLTICELDPIAKIPEYKVCAVSIRKP